MSSPPPEPLPLPARLACERSVLLHRALRDLPLELLEPLLTGLRRHADALMPGGLYSDDGSAGCAVGMMLREIATQPAARKRRFRFRSPTIREERPDLARANPRLWHLELLFDVTCNLAGERLGVAGHETAGSVGLWMAAEVQAEVSLRRMEATALPDERRRSLSPAPLDERVFHDTVGRLQQLRPWLTEGQASRLVEAWVGARRMEIDPLFVPDDWAGEVERQRDRTAATPAPR